MDLTTEQKLAINMKVARDIGLEVDDSILPYDGYIPPVIYKTETFARPFDIFDQGKGDLLKALFHYGLIIEPFGIYWQATNPETGYTAADPIPEDAIIKAVIAASGVE